MRALLLSLLLPTAAPGQTTVADVRRPGDEALWVFERAGQEFGTAWMRYEGPRLLGGTTAHVFREQVRLALPSRPGEELEQRMTMDLVTDELGRPLQFTFLTLLGDARVVVRATVADGNGQVTVVQGAVERELKVPVPTEAWLLTNNFIGELELALALNAADPAATRAFPLFSANQLRTLPFRAEYRRDGEAGGAWSSDSLGESLLWRDGRLERVELDAQGLVIRRVERDYAPFVLPAPVVHERPEMDREEVAIRHDDVVLSGTITRPPGAAGRLPALCFVSGSGGQDRDGWSGGIDVGTWQLLDHLTLAGFAVLRVDDRGVGRSVGPTQGLGYSDLVADARACVTFLMAHDGVDSRRVGLIGHSEGGITVPILAAEMPRIAAVVLMAAPGRPLADLLAEQLERTAPEGADDAERRRLREVTREVVRRVAAGESLDGLDVPAALAPIAAERRWLAEHAAIDPLADIAEVRCPILILQGGRDVQVSAERDAPALAARLKEIGHPDATLAVFPDLDHLFKRTDGSRSVSLDYLTDRPVDPDFLDTLTAWLTERLGDDR